MTDTENLTPVGRPPRETIAKIAFGALGAPQAFLADENINKATMGHIYGVISGTVTKTRENPTTGEVDQFVGLRGSFKALPIDEKKPEKRSAVLYLPSGLDEILNTVIKMEKAKEPVLINMAAEIFCFRAKNAAGYSWGMRSMLPEDEDGDPLAALEKMAKGAPALAAPTSDPETGAAERVSEKVPVGGKHKG